MKLEMLKGVAFFAEGLKRPKGDERGRKGTKGDERGVLPLSALLGPFRPLPKKPQAFHLSLYFVVIAKNCNH